MTGYPVWLLGLAAAAPAGAATLPDLGATTPAAEGIVVSASRVTTEPREIGSAVTVVRQRELQQGQFLFAKDALQDVPGVMISSDRPGDLASVSIRGSDNDEVLWLIDGVELGDPSLISTQVQPENLTTRDIARIEVLRGNQSSLYGSDAIGGVVNIVTSRATAEGWSVNAEAELGSHETLSGGASLIGKSGPVDLRVTATGYRHGGPSLADPATADPPGSIAEDDENWRYGVSGRAGVQATDTLSFQALGFWLESESDVDSTTADSSDTAWREEYALAAQGSYRSPGGRLRADLSATRYETRRRYFGLFTAPDGDVYEGTKDVLGLAAAWGGDGPVSIAAGGGLEWEKTDQATGFSGDFAADVDTRSAYAELALRPVAGLTITGAARVDDNSRFGSFGTYRGTAAYALGPAKLRASYGTGAKAPGLYQLFDPTFGNPNLGVQTSEGGDAGIDLALGGELTAELTYFWGRKKNEIVFDSSLDPFGGGYTQYGRTRVRGIEVGLGARPLTWLELRQTYSYIDHEVDVDETGRYVDSGRPSYVATSTVTVTPMERTAITLRVRYRDGDGSGFGGDTDPFVVADLLASYAISDRIEIYGRIVNLTGEQYQLTYGTQTLGISGYGGLRVTL